MDDKAYLRPETSEGAKGARQQTILQPSDETQARALPVHDYPEASVYITPSAFMLIRKTKEVVDDKVTLIADTDDSIVVVEPKAYVPTHASTWASNSMMLRWEKPNLHETHNLPPRNYPNYSEKLRGMCARIHDAAFYYVDTATDADMQSVTEANDCSFRRNEELCLRSLKQQVTTAKEKWGGTMEDNGRDVGVSINEMANSLLESISKAESEMQNVEGKEFENVLKPVVMQCNDVLRHIATLQLPPVYQRLLELTDAGPGVGVSSAECRWRLLEKARIHNSDKVLRIHRAREDSGQNEAERLNACIGDALCDGGSLKWQIYKPLHGLSEDDISSLANSELETQRKANMVKKMLGL